MKIALLGFDLQGRSAYEYWNKPGNSLTICDKNTAIAVPDDTETQLGDNYLEDLDRFDLLVRTPGLHPRDIAAANPNAPEILGKVTTVTNEFMRVCPSSNIVGITGTKGKGTTSTLIAKILEASGKKVHLGGNIGIPPLELLKNGIAPEDWVVLELANFQTIDIQYSPHIGVCLMIEEEHLNWHADFAEYVDAKRQLFIHQDSSDLMVYNAVNHASIDIARSSKAQKLWYKASGENNPVLMPNEDIVSGAYVNDGSIYMAGTEICKTDEIALLGRHNWQNICAAVAATWEVTNHNVDAARSVITTFRGLEHRLEHVRTLNGVRYYDDSFGTTPQTAIVALEAFSEPKIIILGGSEKNATYDQLARAVSKGNVMHVILIGETASAIKSALLAEGFENIVEGAQNMSEIVTIAHDLANDGDIVLLSTACASFDMFENYKDRGEQFHEAVNAL